MSDTIQLDNWIDDYVTECEFIKGCSPYTLRLYRQAFKVWPKFGHGIHPDGATAAIIEARKRGLAPGTVNIYLRALKVYWNWLHARGDLEAPPKIKFLPVPKKVRAVFNSDQAYAVLRAKPQAVAVKRIQALFAVALDTGLRYGELASLRRADIDLRSRILTVHGKVGPRRVPISTEGLRYLIRHAATHGFDRIFGSNTGTLLDYSHARRELKTLFQLAGVPVELAQFHHIRRYSLRQYVGKVGLRGAQLLAGHSRPETTLLYLDADAELRALPHETASALSQLTNRR